MGYDMDDVRSTAIEVEADLLRSFYGVAIAAIVSTTAVLVIGKITPRTLFRGDGKGKGGKGGGDDDDDG